MGMLVGQPIARQEKVIGSWAGQLYGNFLQSFDSAICK